MVPATLIKLKSLIGEKEFDYYNEKFTTYMSNDIGIYNWLEIFSNGITGEKGFSTKEIKSIENDANSRSASSNHTIPVNNTSSTK